MVYHNKLSLGGGFIGSRANLDLIIRGLAPAWTFDHSLMHLEILSGQPRKVFDLNHVVSCRLWNFCRRKG